MGLSVTTTIFLFVVCLCGGIVIGALFNRSKKQPVETPSAAVEEIKAIEPVEVQNSLAGKDDIEILRAWRDRNGKIWIEMNEARYESKDAMNPDQRRRLLNMVLELRPWLDAQAPAQAQAPTPRPQVQEAPRPVTPAPRPSLFAPIAPQKTTPKADDGKPKISLKSIVEQIDEVLQKKVASSVFKSQDIHLLDGPAGTVIVEIEKIQYEGIDAVPDPEIKALIRLAVTDWEKGPQ